MKSTLYLTLLAWTPSEAVLLYYKQIAMNHGIPFEIKIPNAETAEAIREARNGKDLKKYCSVDELFQDLED